MNVYECNGKKYFHEVDLEYSIFQRMKIILPDTKLNQ